MFIHSRELMILLQRINPTSRRWERRVTKMIRQPRPCRPPQMAQGVGGFKESFSVRPKPDRIYLCSASYNGG
jgi:hypothetical protein